MIKNQQVISEQTDKEEQASIIVTQNTPDQKMDEDAKEENAHPDGCCGQCS